MASGAHVRLLERYAEQHRDPFPEDGPYSSRLTAGDFNWILWENAPSEPVEVSARTRYNGREAEATVWADPDGTVHVEFRKPQRAVTAGQAVVLYLGDIVVGGGTILSAE